MNKKLKYSKRHMARELAFKSLYSFLFQPNDNTEEIFNNTLEQYPPKEQNFIDIKFAKKLYENALHFYKIHIDKLLSLLKGWKWDRVGTIEKSLLILGASELMYEETSLAIVISEVLELAKEYSDPKAPKFINGILDNFYNKFVKQQKDKNQTK